jgi:hypothetical protein
MMQAPEATALVQSLDDIVATIDVDRPFIVVDKLRVRAALGLPAPQPLSQYARAIEAIEHGDFSAVIALLPADRADSLLRGASTFIDPAHAVALADVLEQRSQPAGARLAALLAILDPARCVRLLDRLNDVSTETEFIEGVTEAYLALADGGAAIPGGIGRAWAQVIDPNAPSSSSDGARWSARLRAHARRDPQEALATLDAAVAELGAADVAEGVIAVLARARAWATVATDRPVESRAFMLAGLVRGDPDAPELGDALERLVAEWQAGGWGVDRSIGGAFGMAMPLLAAAAMANRDDLIGRVRDAFQPSPDQVRWATFAEMRRRFLASGHWDPATWERWVPADYRPIGLASHAPIPIPAFSTAQLAAWWKLSTLPLPTLPWHHAWGAGLP